MGSMAVFSMVALTQWEDGEVFAGEQGDCLCLEGTDLLCTCMADHKHHRGKRARRMRYQIPSCFHTN